MLSFSAQRQRATDYPIPNATVHSYKTAQCNPFSSKSEFFRHLVNDESDLQIYLAKHPTLINAQDENGMTLLHHSATIGRTMKSSAASRIQQLLFRAPKIDFNVKNAEGDTPVHIATAACDDRVSSELFPEFLRQAISHRFDCSAKGARGYTILHLSALHSYDDHMAGSRNENVTRVLGILSENKVPNLKLILNTLSDSGVTALYYCILNNKLEEMEVLIKAGATPLLYGQDDRNPLKAVRELKQSLDDRYEKVYYDRAYDGNGELQSQILKNIAHRIEQVNQLPKRLEQGPSWWNSVFGEQTCRILHKLRLYSPLAMRQFLYNKKG